LIPGSQPPGPLVGGAPEQGGRCLENAILVSSEGSCDASIYIVGDSATNDMALPLGVRIRPLEPHYDRRGWLVEAFRESWAPGVEGAQVNITWSRAGTLRGSHVHGIHSDYFVLASGRAAVGIRDVRKRSPTFGITAVVELSSESPSAMSVPPGVLHGLYFPVDSILLTVESRIKRRHALRHIRELRAVAHIVDMHQLSGAATWTTAARSSP